MAICCGGLAFPAFAGPAAARTLRGLTQPELLLAANIARPSARAGKPRIDGDPKCSLSKSSKDVPFLLAAFVIVGGIGPARWSRNKV